MKGSLDISVSSPLWCGLPRARAIARETITAAAAESGRGGDVSLCLADDAVLRALNLRWRGLDKPTNVLSFPAAPPVRHGDPVILGDIALAYETLAREAEGFGVPLVDHCRHLLAHGFLHLVGYDHETDAEAERMEALETRILRRLGAGDPYTAQLLADDRDE
jgi:probable rRNA maturation factor